MQVPSMLEGESLKRLLQGAAAGAVATIFVGFYWGGWSLGSTADKTAKERSELAVVAALAPVCADKFRALPDAAAKQVALSKVELVEASGRNPQGVRDPAGRIVPEFRPCGRVLHAVACAEVSRAQIRQPPQSGKFLHRSFVGCWHAQQRPRRHRATEKGHELAPWLDPTLCEQKSREKNNAKIFAVCSRCSRSRIDVHFCFGSDGPRRPGRTQSAIRGPTAGCPRVRTILTTTLDDLARASFPAHMGRASSRAVHIGRDARPRPYLQA